MGPSCCALLNGTLLFSFSATDRRGLGFTLCTGQPLAVAIFVARDRPSRLLDTDPVSLSQCAVFGYIETVPTDRRRLVDQSLDRAQCEG